jgi:hypothetical protein
MMQGQPVFKPRESKDIRVGDVWQSLDENPNRLSYYYFRAESVRMGDILDAIHDPMTGKFVGNRVTNCVEITWVPLSYQGNAITFRYHQLARLDIASDVLDVDDLIQEEEATE